VKYNYIAIEREYGSGGTKIARKLADECGIPCYGREILEMVSEEQGITVDEIDRYEESVTNSFLYSLYVIGKVQKSDPDMMAKEGHIFAAEQKVIRELATQGPAVFLGHCASEALSRRQGVLRVFIHSDSKDKARRVIEDYRIPRDKIESTMHRFDKKRANYYYANTTKKWDDFKNYDLILNSGTMGIDGCVALLKSLMK